MVQNLPMTSDVIHMNTMDILARAVVDLNFNGKQIAYHRSTEMNVNVKTDTATDTV